MLKDNISAEMIVKTVTDESLTIPFITFCQDTITCRVDLCRKYVNLYTLGLDSGL